MKKLLPVLIVVIVVVGLWYAISPRIAEEPGSTKEPQSVSNTGDTGVTTKPVGDRKMPSSVASEEQAPGEAEQDTEEQADERPAAERYKSAEEALAAVKTAASNFDDLVLDQFTQPGDNCTWCPQFYSSVKELLFSAEATPDQKSYYSEILAISGKVDNVKTLVDAINNAKNQDEADIYAQALELTVGNEDVVKYLGTQLSSSNESLKESAVAAITNQGSRLAVETLYKSTLEKGDPDGYYSLGIGLGEVVPDEEALPYLQELVLKRDQYSHLAVKATLNAGIDGLKTIMDILSNSKSPDFDKEMLKGAKEHVAFDDEQIAYLKEVAESGKSNPAVDFAKEVMNDFNQSMAEGEAEPQEEGAPDVAAPMSVMPPK